MKSLIRLLLLASAVICGSVGAQPVTKIVVPFAAGGGTDVYVRLLASEITKAGIPVIVENKPGASGNIAADYVAKSRPDGHTVFVGTNSTMANNTVLFEKLPYDPLKDFVPVTHIGYQPMIIVARTDLPYSTLQEMVAYAKANPGKINRGSPGAGIISNLAPLMFERQAGIRTTHIPFNGDAPGLQALLSGSIDIHGTSITASLPHVQSGKIRVLGVMDNKRLSQVPSAPTFKEAGYDVEAYAWYTLVAPAGTPREAVERLNKAVNQVLVREDFIAKAQAMGMEPRGGSSEELGKYIRKEYERWVPLLKSLELTKSTY
ncbi:ABC transporter substrate-binding protein [Alicycliphilus denitrificans]|uniref:Tripartite tricarboxylate transporter substrate binding protein n=1 Tax=Alicycliphilus denitrificans TaxID=179636 RepID=A0A3R7H592_9BURK|nr:tripartite tricarboxylate transporter substrate binding protein [Alicycliphilus denitrificans]MBN9576703.1 tripartite tricarboxylate transporter substrate binding protein [Alicycliphilus denitrificans]OJW83556.1 MAG: MFS transporter [Alicycliphilus sp. 69-12]RKJ99761.1 tripartite tricarboxylate transporter substrate binding protein [Alicycliphilus denitrificans]BCN38996.1 ABC transporter substrate-binding protein [Alicycliphilus denitrificans]